MGGNLEFYSDKYLFFLSRYQRPLSKFMSPLFFETIFMGALYKLRKAEQMFRLNQQQAFPWSDSLYSQTTKCFVFVNDPIDGCRSPAFKNIIYNLTENIPQWSSNKTNGKAMPSLPGPAQYIIAQLHSLNSILFMCK